MQVGLILAAGSGSRMGQPKAQIEIGGQRLVDRAVSTFIESGITEIYVVLGAWQSDVPHAHTIINSNWQEGMGSSLRVGLEHLLAIPEITSVVVSLVDLPGLTPEAVKKIAQAPEEIVVGTFHGKRGHPVKFTRKYWPEIILSAKGDIGARDFLKIREDIRYIQLDQLATGNDVDTHGDLSQFTQ